MNLNEILINKLTKNREVSREYFGYLEGWVSILGNIFLFIIKFFLELF